MKDVIFAKLKQAYSPLGLGDNILMGQADALAATGLVTNENVDAVVLGQRTFLEGLQKNYDKRVADALTKKAEEIKKAEDEAKKAAEAKAAEDKKKADEELAKKVAEALAKGRADLQAELDAKAEAAKKEAEEKARKKAEEEAKKGMPEWYKTEQERTAKVMAEYQMQIAEMQNLVKAKEEAAAKQSEQFGGQFSELKTMMEQYSATIKALKDENDAMKQQQAKEQHKATILSIAQQLGIPKYRIDEGFANIPEDATEEAIRETLGVVAKNIEANKLPSNFPGGNVNPNNAPTQEEIKSIVSGFRI